MSIFSENALWGHVEWFNPDFPLVWEDDYIASHNGLWYFGFGEQDMFGPFPTKEQAQQAMDIIDDMMEEGTTPQ